MASKALYFNIDYTFSIQGSGQMVVNPAKTWDFGTGITNLATLKAKILELFYLDDILTFTTNYGGVTYHGFWGLVNEGGANASMRNSNRLTGIKVPIFTVSRQILNDAGLNTYGVPYGLGTVSRFFYDVIVKAKFKSAWLLPTTSMTLYWRSQPFEGPGGWTAWESNTINGQDPKLDVEYEYNIGSTYPGKLWYEIYATITNPEGTKTSSVYSFYTQLKSQVLHPDSYSNPAVTYYIDRPSIITAEDGGETQLFNDIDGTSQVFLEREYWTSSTFYYFLGPNPVTGKWVFLYSKDTTAPPPAPIDLLAINSGGVASTYDDARDLFDLNVPGSPVNLYFDPAQPNQYYSDVSLNTPAEGYWSIDSVSSPGVYSKTIYLLEGYKIYEQI